MRGTPSTRISFSLSCVKDACCHCICDFKFQSRWSIAFCRHGSFLTSTILRRSGPATTRSEIAKIVEKIPAKDLAIQWDCSTEVQDAYGGVPGYPLEGAIGRNLEQVRSLSPHIPSDVALGYHFCFGTLGGWPRFQPNDLGQLVNLANAFITASGRRVDWIHIPILDRTDESFFAPLKNLKPQGARVYLGAIHNMERFQARIAVARKYLPEFGLGAYCGFGRLPASQLRKILADHLT